MIEIEIVASNAVRDVTRREADIAIRHVRPDQPDLIAKLVRTVSAHLYASRAFLDRHGRPGSAKAVSGLDFIGFESPERLLGVLNPLGLSLSKSNFKYISNNGVVVLELVKQGLGIGLMTKEIADLTPDLEQVLPALDPIPVPIWLVTHRELHTSRRIHLVFDVLAAAFA